MKETDWFDFIWDKMGCGSEEWEGNKEEFNKIIWSIIKEMTAEVREGVR